MADHLTHRGPDEHGVFVDDDVVLAVRRLAVIDPTHGQQPLHGPGGRVLVANGEIYGHQRLRQRFPSHPYRSGSDLEVIHPLVQQYGDDFLSHLPGTFALALWDPIQTSLLLARDRYGERPLYWTLLSDGCLAFSSEVGALREVGLISGRLDLVSISEMLRQGYVPPDRSIWEDVSSLPHASHLRFTPGGQPQVTRWWTPPDPTPSRRSAPTDVQGFRADLDRAVQDQLVADVPVGTLLSGGLDSSAISVLAHRHHPGITAFTCEVPGNSELSFAREVADRHGIDLQVLSAADIDLPQCFLDVAGVWDEPFGDTSTIPTMLLSRFVRESVKVALTGDGADELLGGYLTWTRGMLPPTDPIRGGDQAVLRKILRRLRGSARSGGESQVAQQFAGFRSYFSPTELVRLGLPPTSPEGVDVSTYDTGTLEDICRFDLDHYLPGDILVKTDRASMAVGLEVRAPFLDQRLAERCHRLPPSQKADAHQEKLILREAVRDLLPDSVIERSKRGFGSPMSSWLTDPGVQELIRHTVGDPGSKVGRILDSEVAATYMDQPDQRLWNLLTFGLWAEQSI